MKQTLTLFVLVIILSTCKKPEDEMLRKKQALQASASASSDAETSDIQAFTEFTDVFPNPRASENLREVPPPNVHHPEPPEKPLYKSVRIRNFKPLGQDVTKTYDYNIPGFLLNKIGAENLYKRLAPIEHTVYYNNTLYEFLDIPAPSNQYFNATFTFTAQQGAPQTLYARLFYESVSNRAAPNSSSGYWGGSENIVTFQSSQQGCYKLLKADVIKKIKLKEKRFGFEPEVTAKIARVPDIRIYEVGISYYGRTYKDGKKINWKDGIRAIYCIVRYGLFE